MANRVPSHPRHAYGMDSMAISHLRIYHGPESAENSAKSSTFRDQQGRVTVPLSDVVSALAHAARHQRSWLDDFKEDEVTISTDLYEVILAYQYYHGCSPSAR